MRNVLDAPPAVELHGIPLQATRQVDASDLNGRDVLDVGCGFGWFELFALSQGARSMTGIEPAEEDLATARKHIREPNVEFVKASATELPFEDASFDTVVMWEVIEHVPEHTETQVFSEIRRVLRDGGRFYLSTPFDSLASKTLDPAWWLIKHRHYSTERLREFARGAGMNVDRLETRGGHWQIGSMLNLYIAKWVFRRQPFFEQRINERVDAELSRTGGYANCFMVCTAV